MYKEEQLDYIHIVRAIELIIYGKQNVVSVMSNFLTDLFSCMCKHVCASVDAHMYIQRSEVSLGCNSARIVHHISLRLSFSLGLGNYEVDKQAGQ